MTLNCGPSAYPKYSSLHDDNTAESLQVFAFLLLVQCLEYANYRGGLAYFFAVVAHFKLCFIHSISYSSSYDLRENV